MQKLKVRDGKVRAHEQAHLAAAGAYARSGARFEYQEGPDKRRYAVGGEVSIDVSPVAGDAQATVRKAQVVRRAALAPAEPSPQDRHVAAAAAAMEGRARQELAHERAESIRNATADAGLSRNARPAPEVKDDADQAGLVPPGDTSGDDPLYGTQTGRGARAGGQPNLSGAPAPLGRTPAPSPPSIGGVARLEQYAPVVSAPSGALFDLTI